MSHLDQPTISQGFRTYMAQIARSGLPAVRATCEEYLSLGNRNARFQRYCEDFGSNWPRQDEALDDRQSVLEALLDGESEDTPKPITKRTRNGRKRSKNGRLDVGAQFTYAGKRRKSTWTIIEVGHNWTTKGGEAREGYLARNSDGRESGWAFHSVERMLKSGKITL